VKTLVKLTFVVCAIALMMPVAARAQVDANRVLSTPIPAPETLKPGEKPPLFIVNDNTLGYRYAATGTDPGSGKTPKNDLWFNHFDVWAYGTNFVSFDWLTATNGRVPPLGAPAAPCDQGYPTYTPGSQLCPGYTEIYALIRSTLGWNQIFNTKAFSIGPLTNIEFIVGGDYNVDNTTEGSAKRDVVGGLQFDFQTPYKGSLTVGVMAYQEWQHDGFAAFLAATPGTYQIYPNASGNVRFDPTWDIEINYTQPLGDTPFTFRSVATIHGQKGCGEPCGFGAPGYLRTNEYFTQQQLVFDVGKVLWNEPQRYVIFGAYRWWDNKFGIAATQPINGVPQRVPGAIETGWSGGAAMKF
jgi:hypothetical protein